MTQGHQPHCGTVLGWNTSPEIPSLSNGMDAVSSLLVVVGGITFYFERGAFRLVNSQCPIVPYLLQEDKTRVTRVVRVLQVDTKNYQVRADRCRLYLHLRTICSSYIGAASVSIPCMGGCSWAGGTSFPLSDKDLTLSCHGITGE
jgi:hypothetical protein